MCRFAGFFLAAVLAALGVTRAAAQRSADDPPRLLVPKDGDVKAKQRRAALYRFVAGVEAVRAERLLEGLKAFQESVELDPEPAAPYKAQLPLLLGLERAADALAACQQVLKRHPNDYEVWAILGRLHKAMAHYPEARQALEKGIHAAGLDARPELAQQMHYDLGSLYEADGQVAAAAEAYTRAAVLLDHPDVIAEHVGVARGLVTQRAADIYERIGDLHCKAKQYRRAIAAYRKAQERAPTRAERLNFNLAQVCVDKGDDAAALRYLDAYLSTQPMGMEAYEMKLTLLRRGDNAAAILPWLEQAVKVDVFNVGLQLLLARECGLAKQAVRAEQLYRQVAETSPSAELYRGLLALYRNDGAKMVAVLDQTVGGVARKGEPGASTVAQAKAIVAALREDQPLAHAVAMHAARLLGKGKSLQFETLQVLAVFAEKNRQLAEAERFYRGCLRRLTPEAETMVYGGLIRVLGAARKYEAQVEACDGALTGNVERGLPKAQATSQLLFLMEKARALAGLHRHEEAVLSADRALLVASDNNRLLVRHLHVRLLTMARRFADAEKECLGLIEKSSRTAETLEARYLLSNVYSQAKQLAKAEGQLKLILEADPDNPTANNDLGYFWAEQNKHLPEAEQMIRRAIAADRRQRSVSAAPALPGEPAPPMPIVPVGAVEVEDNAAFVDSLGWVLFRRGQVEQARQELERACRLPDGEDPVIWEHLGDIFLHLHRPAEARRALEHAVRLYQQGERRKDDERCKELQRKLQTLPSTTGAR